MTALPQLDERDPLPPREWRETSHAAIRRHALEAAERAVRASRDKQTARSDTTEESDRNE